MAGERGIEATDPMHIEWDVPIRVDDGLVLRADVFRPARGRHPALLSYGPYGKGLAFQDGYGSAWQNLVGQYPEVAAASSNAYQNWEVADPERWVPHGYACVRVDSRGAGRSPGVIDHFSPRETQDLYEAIEWAARQPWCTGRVGLSGVSYYAINQWQVAALQPPHLVCICPWEGAVDFYRDVTHHGGIHCTFLERWSEIQVSTVQHGLGSDGPVNPHTGQWVCGDERLPEAELRMRRADVAAEVRAHPFDDEFHAARTADLSRIRVPVLSAGNWGGQGLHLRGNVEGFRRSGSSQKWLELHGREHWTEYYTDYGVALQRRFFDHFLKGADNGWEQQPPVMLQVRTVDGFVQCTEEEWPPARTRHVRLHLDASERTLRARPPGHVADLAFDDPAGVTFTTAPFDEQTEITGMMSARLYVSSSTTDADVFVTVRAFDPAGEELLFTGAIDPQAPLAQGWLRASHRALDEALSVEARPYHRHDRRQPLEPGEVVELDVEIWPTSVVLPVGYRLAVTIGAQDFDHGRVGARFAHFANELRGCGPFIHPHRPDDVAAAIPRIHTGTGHPSSILVPVVPSG